MNAPIRHAADQTLPRPGWEPRDRRFYSPVDLVMLFDTPDGIARTIHYGVYQTVADAQEAVGSTVWTSTGDGLWLSECGRYRIQPVST